MGTGEFEIVEETSETQTSDNNNNSGWKEEEGEEAFSNPVIGIAPGFYEQPTLLIDANGFLAYPNQVIDYNNYGNMLSWFPANDGYLYTSPPPPPPELVLPMAAVLMNGYYSVNPYAGFYPWNNSNIIPSSLSNPAIGGGALLPSPYPSIPYNILPPLIDDSQHSLKLNDWRIPVDSTEKDEPKEIEISAEPEEEDSWEAGSKNKTTKNILPLAQVYNRLDFVTKYEDAKFFIIKSYSEDNVQKSLQFGVWSSTPNGNRKLDEAFWDAQRRAKDTFCSCPIFLFFSINRSRQFCGVAEMSGPVDYLKTMGFWEQDKWNGSFPVKWHIVKDVPNSQLRRIVLDGENKPVTNSRDTQEVNISKGIELLRIFKNYPSRTSILDTLKNLYLSSDE